MALSSNLPYKSLLYNKVVFFSNLILYSYGDLDRRLIRNKIGRSSSPRHDQTDSKCVVSLVTCHCNNSNANSGLAAECQGEQWKSWSWETRLYTPSDQIDALHGPGLLEISPTRASSAAKKSNKHQRKLSLHGSQCEKRRQIQHLYNINGIVTS